MIGFLRRLWAWLTWTEPTYQSQVNVLKDRSLHGKDRRRARRLA